MYDLQAIDFEIDHIVVVVPDLDTAAVRIHEVSGLQAQPGGKHPGHGTENWIIPLGPNYLELLSVVDQAEAAGSAFGGWASDRLSRGAPGVDLICLRTSDLIGLAERLSLDPLAMSRQLPDGTTLSWRIAGLEESLGSQGVPFFIEWDSMMSHPGMMQSNHGVTTTGITDVDIAGGVAMVNLNGAEKDVTEIVRLALNG
jgi:hypothetical protein